MSDTVVKIENLSKKYRLGVIGYGTLRADLKSSWARLRGREDPNAEIGKESRLGKRGDFWALRDVSFDVKQGDRLGIIGRNGAGKSTLLKILSRITAPTEGRVKVKGRVASLLEVGTGFHAELTGRENIFLNGAILGMKRREIQKSFSDIVEFAGVGSFIDTPVKRYSSGMYVRLAFSVAAHLNSDILVLDEVLAVGDADFQRRCLGKLEDLNASEGRTILFVSHHLHYLRRLCLNAVLMHQGECQGFFPVDKAIEIYTSQTSVERVTRDTHVNNRDFRRGTGEVVFEDAFLCDANGKAETRFLIGEKIAVEFSVRFLESVDSPAINVAFKNSLGGDILTSCFNLLPTGTAGTVFNGRIVIDSSSFRPGDYYPYVWAGDIAMRKKFEVLDGVLGPIELSVDSRNTRNYNELLDKGYFSITSQLISRDHGGAHPNA